MIRETFCSFELAKLLKEKGFNEPCMAIYKEKSLCSNPLCNYFNSELSSYVCAQTHQMAMAWLRTKHIIIVIQPKCFNLDGICPCWGVDIWADDNYEELQGDYPEYEKACEAGIKYTLENLI